MALSPVILRYKTRDLKLNVVLEDYKRAMNYIIDVVNALDVTSGASDALTKNNINSAYLAMAQDKLYIPHYYSTDAPLYGGGNLSTMRTLSLLYDATDFALDASDQLYILDSGIDHGGISGLSDDDHTQYSLVDGTRAFSGVVGGVTPTLDAHLATKKYVDDSVVAFPAHQLTGAKHTETGLTIGHFLKATGATTFGFAAHGLTYSDVGAAASVHNHDSDYISIISSPGTNKFPYQTAGGELVDSTYDASSFALSGHNHSGVYEPVLGNPASDGYVLSSTALGVRSWIAPGVGAHNLLSVTHGDTAAASPVEGDVLYANATPAWTKLAKGTTAQYLKGGDAPSWATLNQAAVAGLTTSDHPTFDYVGATAGGTTIYMGSVSGAWRFDTDGTSIRFLDAADSYAPMRCQYLITTNDLGQTLAVGNVSGYIRMQTDGTNYRFLNAADDYAPLQFGIIKGEGASGTNYLKTTLDVQALLQCDSFRIDQTPTSGTFTPTHYITIACNGSNYKIAVRAV